MVCRLDGLDGVDACYHLAGFVGVQPAGLTLRALWRMANGKQFYRRQELVSLSQLVWGLSEIDLETFVYYGTLEESGVGGPVQLDPELQARVDAEAERLRKTVPGLPTVRGSNGTI